MKLIFGLGNPGEKYANSHHNLGFMILNRFLEDAQTVEKTKWQHEEKYRADIVTFDWGRKDGTAEKVILAKPQTFMNSSGTAVKLLTDYFKVDSTDMWVVYDELDLPLGAMKIRLGGAAAGHRGVEHILETLGTDKFWRFRMGIGQSREHIPHSEDDDDGRSKTLAKHRMHDAADYVLADFDKTEATELKKLLKDGSESIQTALEEGIDSAQNRFNTK